MLWLIASEDPEQSGALPDLPTLAFRLRITETQLKQHVTKLSAWLEQDDIKPISGGYQDDALEKRRDREETETEKTIDRFDPIDPDRIEFSNWYLNYPRKQAKAAAEKAFAKLEPADTLAAFDGLLAFDFPTDPKFIPYPATWLNQRRWEDQSADDRIQAHEPRDAIDDELDAIFGAASGHAGQGHEPAVGPNGGHLRPQTLDATREPGTETYLVADPREPLDD